MFHESLLNKITVNWDQTHFWVYLKNELQNTNNW